MEITIQNMRFRQSLFKYAEKMMWRGHRATVTTVHIFNLSAGVAA